MNDTCNARYPTGLDRCSLAPHDNTVKHKDESTGREWGGKRKSRSYLSTPGGGASLSGSLKPGRLKQRSPKGDERNAWLQCLLYAKLLLQESDNEWNGNYYAPAFHCETCGTVVASTIEEALSILQPGHIEERRHDPGKGVGFGSGGKVIRIGTDSWTNVIPQCPNCNREQDRAQRSNPEFGASA